jgi:O-antigen/teichoic acid export membrane protein
VRALLIRVPRRPLYVALGLAVSGLSIYAFLAVAGRALGPERYASLAALWALVFLAGPGLFGPLEQELARALSSRRASGVGAAPVIRRAALAGLTFAGVLAIIVLVASSTLSDDLFDGNELLVVSFALSLVGYAGFYLARGLLAGSDRFGRYGVLLAAEALVRLAAGIVLAVAASGPGAYGLAVGLAPFIALPLVWRPARRELSGHGPPAPWGELTGMLGWLLMGSLAAQVLVNAGPVVVKWLAGPGEGAEAGSLLAGLLLTRAPLYLFQAVAAAMLPALSALVVAGNEAAFRRLLGRIVGMAGLVCLATLVATAVAGPAALQLLFGPEYGLGRLDLLALAGATVGVILAYTFGSALIALGRHRASSVGWVIGMAAFLVVTALGSDLLTRVEVGLLAGCLGAAGTMALLLAQSVGRVFRQPAPGRSAGIA